MEFKKREMFCYVICQRSRRSWRLSCWNSWLGIVWTAHSHITVVKIARKKDELNNKSLILLSKTKTICNLSNVAWMDNEMRRHGHEILCQNMIDRHTLVTDGTAVTDGRNSIWPSFQVELAVLNETASARLTHGNQTRLKGEIRL